MAPRSRRNVLRLAGTALTIAVAGCGEPADDGGEGTGTEETEAGLGGEETEGGGTEGEGPEGGGEDVEPAFAGPRRGA